jgi:hypothetical protein
MKARLQVFVMGEAIDPEYLRHGRALVADPNQLVDQRIGTANGDLDGAVPAIANPPAETALAGFLARPGPEPDALHTTVDYETQRRHSNSRIG